MNNRKRRSCLSTLARRTTPSAFQIASSCASTVMADSTAVALQLVAAMTAVRRAGIVPVVGLLTADQVADLNDITTVANQVLEGAAEASASAEVVQNFSPMVAGGVGGGSAMPSGAQTPASTVGVAPPDLAISSMPTTPRKAPPPVPKEAGAEIPARRPVMKAPPQVPATTWRVTPLDQLPRKAAPTSTATSGTSTPAKTTGGETPADYFATPAAKARAAARLAAGADPFDATLSMSASASGLATPAQSTAGRRPPNMQEIRAAPNVQTEAMAAAAPSTASTRPTSPKAQGKAPPEALMPPTTLMAPEPTPAADHQHIDPDLGIPAVTTVVADTFLDTPLEPTASAQEFLGPAPPPRPFFSLSTASTTRSPTPPSPRVDPPTAASASEFLGAASAGVPAQRPMTTVPEEDRPEPWEMPAAERRSIFPPVTAGGTGGRNMRAPSAARRRGSVGPSPGQRAQWRRDARSQDERRQYGAYDSRRWGGAEPWTAEQVDIPAEYYPYKVSMERRGASALGEVVPSSLRHLACDDLAAVRQKEQELPALGLQCSTPKNSGAWWDGAPTHASGADNHCDGEGRSALSLAPPDEAERQSVRRSSARGKGRDHDDATTANMAQDASAPQPGTFAAFLAEVAAAGGQGLLGGWRRALPRSRRRVGDDMLVPCAGVLHDAVRRLAECEAPPHIGAEFPHRVRPITLHRRNGRLLRAGPLDEPVREPVNPPLLVETADDPRPAGGLMALAPEEEEDLPAAMVLRSMPAVHVRLATISPRPRGLYSLDLVCSCQSRASTSFAPRSFSVGKTRLTPSTVFSSYAWTCADHCAKCLGGRSSADVAAGGWRRRRRWCRQHPRWQRRWCRGRRSPLALGLREGVDPRRLRHILAARRGLVLRVGHGDAGEEGLRHLGHKRRGVLRNQGQGRRRGNALRRQVGGGGAVVEFMSEVRRLVAPRRFGFIFENVEMATADAKQITEALGSAPVWVDAADFGWVGRPRLWWLSTDWARMTLDPETGESLQWTRRGQWDRLRVEEARRPVEVLDLGDLTFDDSVLSGRRRLPCFTTPALDENGRTAPKGCRGKIPSDAQQRWSADRRQFAPWHYVKEAMVVSSDAKLQIPPSRVKEQLHHMPADYTWGADDAPLDDRARHRLIGNGWHWGVARHLLLILLVATAFQTSDAKPQGEPPRSTITWVTSLWQFGGPVMGPAPGEDTLDPLVDLDEEAHWAASAVIPHPFQAQPRLEPAWEEALKNRRRWRHDLARIRREVVQEVKDMLGDVAEQTAEWMSQRSAAVKATYSTPDKPAVTQIPVLLELLRRLNYPDLENLTDDLTQGFNMVGGLKPGPGWKKRTDDRDKHPASMEELRRVNADHVRQRTATARVGERTETLLQELIDEAFEQLFAALGFRIKVSKSQPAAAQHIVQGVLFEISRRGVTLSPTPERVRRIMAQITQALQKDAMKPDEVFAQVAALAAFATHLQGAVTAFIDNTAGQAALSKGYGKDPAMNGMLAAFWALAARQGTMVDFRRVPSKANVADAVSPDDFGRARREGWTRVHIPASPIMHILAKAVDDLLYAVDGAAADLLACSTEWSGEPALGGAVCAGRC
ncbi:unnamed protein product [Symbiodinium necroappetens]|uniref:Uncharacterized protein n=1 Tax=Symbiodinium necroappetens TaxID=1628268 RepID=A0A813BC36_9DINO|nr:unnamed protein product [Symbiodinium necroappetens]